LNIFCKINTISTHFRKLLLFNNFWSITMQIMHRITSLY
jgi:hypothetical protein